MFYYGACDIPTKCSPIANYVEGKICDKAADEAEHELRRELSRRIV